jgi:TonB family protein
MNIAAALENLEGQLVDGRFPLLHWLGSSEHSVVFLTNLPGQELQKAVIKLFPADVVNAKTRISRWKVIAGLSHPHLIRLFHMGECEINATSLLYVVLEYAEEDLSQVVPSRPLTPAEAGEMLPPVIDVLSYLHEKGLVHGHVKPSNIMVVADQLKLSCDSIRAFGESDASAFEPSVYDSPETTTGTILSTADVWSLGVMLVTALTQHPPSLEKSGQGDPILSESIPEPFQDIVRSCLRRDPKDRGALEDVLARLHSSSAPLKTVEGTAATGRRLIRRLMTPVAVGLIVLVVLAGLIRVTHRPHAQPTLATNRAEQPGASSASGPSEDQSAEATPGTPMGVVVHGTVAERVLPDVPQDARKKIRGNVRVSVRVFVNPAGEVSEATTSNSRGRKRYLAGLALQAARGWKFHPPQIDGQNVASEWILRFQFRRSETLVVPSLRVTRTSSLARRHRQKRKPLSA